MPAITISPLTDISVWNNSQLPYDSVHIAKLLVWYFEKRESEKRICINVQISAAACWDVPTELVSPCEKPTPTGWSMNKTLASLFQEKGFSVTYLLSLVIRHGPSSCSRPNILELPGWRILSNQWPVSRGQNKNARHRWTREPEANCPGRFVTQKTRT